METSTESSYLCAIECKNCSLYYSVRLEDLVDPLACPYCAAKEQPVLAGADDGAGPGLE